MTLTGPDGSRTSTQRTATCCPDAPASIPEARRAAEPGRPAAVLRWAEITYDFRRRTTRSLRDVLVADKEMIAPLHRLDECFSSQLPPEEGSLDVVVGGRLHAAFAVADQRAGGHLAMACYMHSRCLEAWEGSTSWERITAVVNAAVGVADDRREDVPEEESEAARLILGHTSSINHAMSVEEGMNCSCPIAMQERADRVVEVAERTREALHASVHLAPDARSYLDMVVETDRTYFTAIRTMGRAVVSAIMECPEAGDELDAAIAALAEGERSRALAGDVYSSELKAHRLTLEELRRRLNKPRLHVDKGRATYVYPFSILLMDAHPSRDSVTERLAKVLEEVTGWELCGLRPTAVQPLTISQGLTDFWEGADEQNRYRGHSVFLPAIRVLTNDQETLSGDVELRLSTLGNHYLRVQVDVPEGHPHFVNQALRRGSADMGAELVTDPEEIGSWSTIHEYAQAIITAFADRVIADAADGPAYKLVDGPHHVVLSVRTLSVVENGVWRPSSGTALLDDDLMGARLFWQAVAGPAATLEEWLRYPKPDCRNLVEDRGLLGDLVLQTSTTTIVAMPDKPSFLITSFEEAAEFVASLRALMANWQRLVQISVADGRKDLERTANGEGVDTARELQAGQEALHEIKSHVQSQLALVKSPAFCKTSINREYLDRLWLAAALDKDEAALESGIRDAQALYERYLSRARALETDREQRQRNRINALAALEAAREQRQRNWINGLVTVVGITGMADFFGLVNDGFHVSDPSAIWCEVAVIAVLGILVGLLLWRGRRGDVTRDQ